MSLKENLTETEKKIESMIEFFCEEMCKHTVCIHDRHERNEKHCYKCKLIAHNRAVINAYEKEKSA